MIDRIYLGDRAIKGIDLNCWDKIIKIKIDCISRVKKGSDRWGFYEEEDLENGYLVFSNISDFHITPLGSIPDDYIIDYSFEKTVDNEIVFKLYSGGMVPGNPENRGGCYVTIKHQESWLENDAQEKINE
ncbi:DUF6258 family protein [Lelliottia wanjuensis]|uniref:DUF6258 family protein n=1 Tax=Lelliottia wanjuensis TaxID=3050585 RepID=UPI00254A46C6|nr:DUF6258 family protein [Lelliottia sp. V104_15]MDK9603956.1 DUF6258 family protein [Lelliottia sp. V104_15]